MPWVKFDDQFTAHRKVCGLTDAEFRLHVEAIFWCARNLTDGLVADSELELVTRLRQARKHAAGLVVRGVWVATDGGWRIHDYLEYQPPKERVIADRQAQAERQRKWRERRNGVTDTVTNDVTNGGSSSVTNAAPSRPVPSRKNKPSSPAALSDEDPAWLEFWTTYPRRVGKPAARKAWAKAVRTTDPATIIAAAKSYAQQRLGQDAQFTAHPATWLNGERWADERPSPPSSGWWNN